MIQHGKALTGVFGYSYSINKELREQLWYKKTVILIDWLEGIPKWKFNSISQLIDT